MASTHMRAVSGFSSAPSVVAHIARIVGFLILKPAVCCCQRSFGGDASMDVHILRHSAIARNGDSLPLDGGITTLRELDT